MHAGSVELQVAWRLILLRAERTAAQPAGESAAKASAVAAGIAKIGQLLSGELQLPFPHICTLPHAVLCQSGCGAMYCRYTTFCAAAIFDFSCVPHQPDEFVGLYQFGRCLQLKVLCGGLDERPLPAVSAAAQLRHRAAAGGATQRLPIPSML